MFYPLFFTKIGRNSKGTRRFLQFNYLVHLIAGCSSVLLFWIYSVNYPLQLSGIVYLIVIVVVVLYYWKSPLPQWNLFSASIVFGVIVFIRSIREIVQLTPLWPGVLIGLLSTGIIAISIFLFMISIWKKFDKNTNLPSVPLILNTLIILIGIRIVWDLVILSSVKIEDQNGILMSVYHFFVQNNIYYLSITILFGLIVPLIIVFIWTKQSRVLNIKKIFWLSFGLLTSVLLSEFIFKYFLLQYGIVL